MRLYRKELHSLEALRGEKIRLQAELRHANAQDFNPLSELGKSKISHYAKEGVLGFMVSLFNSGSNIETAVTIAKPLLKLLGKGKRNKKNKAAGGVREKSIVKRIATELAIGYLTGKAVQMAFRGVQRYIRRKKKHKVDAKHLVM